METSEKIEILSKDDVKIATLYVAVALGAGIAKSAMNSTDDQSAIITSLLMGAVDIITELDSPSLKDLVEKAKDAVSVRTEDEYVTSQDKDDFTYHKELTYAI